jgi:site-specific DNA recombinase
MNKRSRAVILARVSSKAQEDEGYSLDSQLKLLQSYCESKDLEVVKIFKIAETASKDQRRKIFHELLKYLTKNNIYNLAVEKTDRLTRNFRDAVAIDEWLEKNEDRYLHAVKESLLLHKNARSDVKFMWNIHLSVAKKYSDNLREEAMKGWAEKLSQGWLPSTPPPGYMTVVENGKRIHVPNPLTKTLMQDVFKKYLEPNHSIASIAEEMKLMGIISRKGRPYSKSHVQRILTNPFYIGINRFDGKDYPGAQDPIISKDLFDNVQRKMHGGRPLVMVRHNTPLKGLIRCNDCSTLVTWQLQKGRYYGACRRRSPACKDSKLLREDAVEAVIIDMLRKLVCPSSEIIDWVTETMRQNHTNDLEDRRVKASSMQLQIARLKRMDDGLYEDKLAGDITPAQYSEKHQRFTKEHTELVSRLGKLDRTLTRRLERNLYILKLSQKAADIYQTKTPDQKRFLISLLFGELIIEGGTLTASYTKLTGAIAEKVFNTCKIMEVRK